MNILMMYRTKRWDEELLPRLKMYTGNDITLICESKTHLKVARYLDENKLVTRFILAKDFLEGKLDHMRFSNNLGNPPFHEIVGPKKSQQIWAKVVIKAFDLLEDGGTQSMVHPGGWRFITENSRNDLCDLRKIYTENNVIKMEFRNTEDGKKEFGAVTDFDVVTVVKEPNKGKTKVITNTDGEIEINIADYKGIIPTDNFALFNRLKARAGQEKVGLIYSRSAYGTDKTNVSENKTEEFKYPVVYTIKQNDGVVCHYSSTNQNGHFGISKLILKRGASESLLDLNGEYGMTQFACGIVDTPENLVAIQEALSTEMAKKLKIDFVGAHIHDAFIDGLGHMVKVLKEFKKDFWKELV